MRALARAFLAVSFVVALFGHACWALQPEQGAVFIRVVDTGAALCCVVKTDNGQYLVYDAGHWAADGWRAFDGVQQIVPSNRPIAAMVLSHTDSDHIGGVKAICDGYKIKQIVWPGLERDSTTWTNANDAIRQKCDDEGCKEVNLTRDELPASDFRYGDTRISFICGWAEPPASWPLDRSARSGEPFNAGSIIIRLEFAGKSVLFCGDAVGRHKDSPAGTCIATEKFACDHAAERPIRSDVMIAPHHGGNNGSSERFIEAVDPKWVIFSAGHNYHHPTDHAAKRYIAHHIPVSHILRTDRGDDEEDKADEEHEWKHGSIPGHKDPPGDDDIDILIRPNGQLVVAYRDSDSDEGGATAARNGASSPRSLEAKRVVPEWVLRAEALSPEELDRLDHPEPQYSEPQYAEPHRHGLLHRLRQRGRCR